MTGILEKRQIAREVARDLPDGGYVNLGIGLPIMVAAMLAPERDILVHSENGILGMSAPPAPGEEDWDLIDAAKGAVTLRQGGSYLSHADSFAIIRGGHLDVSVMGAFQVSSRGDLANWWNGEGIPGVGGAMDLAVGAKRVFIMMRHLTPSGEPKIVQDCSLPVTARGVVSRIYTEFGIFAPGPDGVIDALALAGDLTLAELQRVTGAEVRLADRVQRLPRAE